MEEAKDITDDTQAEAEMRQGGSELESDHVSGPRALGLSRWVQYVFVLFAAFLFWFFDKVILIVWANFSEPISGVSTGVAAVLAGFIALRFYKHERSHRIATEIVAELAKVTWPSKKETYASSIVVIITSLIMAVIVGGFDFVWSAITDLLYKYKV